MLLSKKRCAAAAVLLLACLSFQACNSSTVLATLNTIVDAANAAVGIIAALNGSGALSNSQSELALSYLEQTTSAASDSIHEWESTDSTDTKITKITQNFSTVATAKMSAITNKEVQTSIATVSAAIQAFLADMKGGSASANLVTPKHHSLSIHDRVKLHSIQSKAEKLKNKIEALREKQDLAGLGGDMSSDATSVHDIPPGKLMFGNIPVSRIVYPDGTVRTSK